MKYDFTVFIGRFQPFHLGHLAVLKEALLQSEKLIIVLGSCVRARSTRNPLTPDERKEIIVSSLTDDELERIIFTMVEDYMYNDDRWVAAVQSAVFNAVHSSWKSGPTKIALVGMYKDETSYYINKFPTWDNISVQPMRSREQTYSATEIREQLFDMMHNNSDNTEFAKIMHPNSKAALENIISKNKKDFHRIASDFYYEKIYSKKYGVGPFMTVDAVVVQSGFVCLIRRGQEYGYNTWAIPGGFVNTNEKLEDAMIRELFEETKIKVPEKVLRGSIKERKIYDDPNRSLRARIITQAYYIRLDDVNKLPKVKGSDDAAEARWFPISQLYSIRDQLFEDHWWILQDLLNL